MWMWLINYFSTLEFFLALNDGWKFFIFLWENLILLWKCGINLLKVRSLITFGGDRRDLNNRFLLCFFEKSSLLTVIFGHHKWTTPNGFKTLKESIISVNLWYFSLNMEDFGQNWNKISNSSIFDKKLIGFGVTRSISRIFLGEVGFNFSCMDDNFLGEGFGILVDVGFWPLKTPWIRPCVPPINSKNAVQKIQFHMW